MRKGGNRNTAVLLVVILAFSIFFTSNVQATAFISVTYTFETPIIEEIEGLHRVTIEGLYNLYEEDKPVLPFGLARILIPQGHEIGNISVDIGEEQVLGEGFSVETGKKEEPLLQTSELTNRYFNFSGTFPDTHFELLRTQIHKGYEIAFIRLYPVHYNGQSGRITYVNEIKVEVTTISTKKGSERNTFRGLKRDAEEVGPMVDNPWTVDTYTQKTRYSSRLPSASYDYVIITNDALEVTFLILANHKNDRGISTTIVTKSFIYSYYGGVDNQEKIRNFITDAYNNWNTTYVLLGGDVEIIPHRGVYGTCSGYTDTDIPCDLYYAGLDGTWDADGDSIYGEGNSASGGTGTAGEEADFFHEVYIGRAPVSNTIEATNFVVKTIAFEFRLAPENASMWGAILKPDPPGPLTWGGDHKDEIIPYFPGTYTISTYYDRDGTASTANWVAGVNAGQNFVNHNAHSSPDSMTHINRANVDSLITNTSDFCLVYSIGCYAASFDNRWWDGGFGPLNGSVLDEYDPDDCIAEHFVMNNTGALAFVGNSRYGWYSPGSTAGSSHQFDRQFFDAIFNENIVNAGEALADSKQDLQGSVGSTGSRRWVYFELNLLGDPETPLLGISPAPNPVDLIFVIDVTGSMWDDIDAVKASATAIVDVIASFASNFRVGIVAYRDHPIPPYGDPLDVMFEDYAFSMNKTTIINNINSLNESGGADWPEAVYDALLRAIDSSSIGGWRSGAKKILILMGDAPPHDPCPIHGYTLGDVELAALLADPAHVYSICIGNGGSLDPNAVEAFKAISEGTGGEAFSASSANDVVDVLLKALRIAILGQPPSVQPDLPPPDYSKMMHPLALDNVKKAEALIEACQEAIKNAPPGKDITGCEKLLEKAKDALEKAHTYFAGGNYIAANYWAIQTIKLLEECIECAEDP